MTAEYAAPLSHARRPQDPATLAFAGVIGESLRARRRPLIRGLCETCFQQLLKIFFSDLAYSNSDGIAPSAKLDTFDEFDEIVELLLEHPVTTGDADTWLAYAIATTAMGDNHLWQDMGLPSRAVLSRLMQAHFPRLAEKNAGDMKWKKFFYRQLCERAGVPICKSSHCGDCCDYRLCFGPES